MPKDQKTILFVEDESEHQKIYRLVFERAGYRFVQVFEGLKAFETVRQEQPDLILLDILLNDINGIEILRKLKKDKILAKIPVIIFTNYKQEATLKEALKLGALDIVFKTDVIPREMVEAVRTKYLAE